MTDKRDLKRRVRERMERTGESYMTALRHVTEQRSDGIDELDEAKPKREPISYVELEDLTAIAKTFAITCRVVKYPSLADLDPRETLAALCLLLGKTRDDRAFDMFRDVLLAGERPRLRLDYHVEESLRFAQRLRAGIGGISNGGHMLALHLDGKAGTQLVLFLLQLTPDFVAPMREPTLVIASLEDTIGIVAMREARSIVKLPP